MNYRRIAIAIALVLTACKEAPAPGSKTAGPQVRATVVTVRTTIEPEKKTTHHAIVIAGDRVRVTNEYDLWRLYDVKSDSVTFVDDVERTLRTQPYATLAREKLRGLARELPSHYPEVSFERTSESRVIHGVSAVRHDLAAGAWHRELWIAQHPAIPRRLFAMATAAEKSTTPLAPMMRPAIESAMEIEGFPFFDRSEVTFGDQKIVVTREVVKIEEKDVPEALVTLPKGYKDLTPAPAKK